MASLQDSVLDSFYLYFHGQQQQQQPQSQHQTYEPSASAVVQLALQQLPQGLGATRPDGGHVPAGTVMRPGPMVDRARLAKLPQPEHQKCPRCDSSNTKFCYFNNYSLSQPRHFCKTCRRYWTRGGVLRNVPVGGGCRRNKRSKSSGSSKSAAAASSSAGASSSSMMSTGTGGGIGAITSSVPGMPQLPFLSSLHPLGTDHQYGGASSLGLGFSAMQPIDSLEYQLGRNSGVGFEHWRLQQAQQFPLLGGMEPPSTYQSALGLYQFNSNDVGDGDSDSDRIGLMCAAQLLPKVSGEGPISRLASIKMEESAQGLNLMSRHYLPLHDSDHFLAGGSDGGGGSSNVDGGWAANLSNFNSSSSSIL